jgi:putative ABC transport system permease protein
MGDRAKYIGILLGLTFASFIITQQAGIFVGIMVRTYSFIADTSQPNIWVMHPEVKFIDDVKPLTDTELLRVKSIEGVEWAVPFYKGTVRANLHDGRFEQSNLIGIDDSTLIGGPPEMLEGTIEDLRINDGVVVNDFGLEKLALLSKTNPKKKIPLKVGDTFDINDTRALIVGICKVSRTFQSQPVIYTTYPRATQFAAKERKLLSYVLVHSAPDENPETVCRRIELNTGLAAYTRQQFIDKTVDYYMKNTGIPINFGVSVLLGFIIGTAIAGQTFYNFTLDHIRFYGTFKAMGAINKLLTKMVVLQAITVGAVGWGLGIGAACIFGAIFGETELAFVLTPALFIFSGLSILIIVITSAFLSLYKIYKLEPAIVFKGA